MLFDFVVYEVSELEHTMNLPCYCAAHLTLAEAESAKFE